MNLPKQVTDFQAAFAPIAKTSFEGIEKLNELNAEVAGKAVADTVSKAKAMLTAKDPKTVLSMMYNPQALTDSVAYFQQVMAIAKDSGAAMSKLVEKQMAEGSKMMNSAIDSLASKAPAGSETLVAMMKSSMSATNSAFERANVAAKQAVEQIESSVTTTSQRVAAAVKANA